jgi:hypothetical protein
LLLAIALLCVGLRQLDWKRSSYGTDSRWFKSSHSDQSRGSALACGSVL